MEVSVDTTDGSYSLEVVKHSGTFTITADYTAADGNYKAGAPQSVTTTAATHSQDIALNYGYTTTLSGQVRDTPPTTGMIINRNGATVIITVEGREAARTTSRTIGGNDGSYRIDAVTSGRLRYITASDGNRTHVISLEG